MLRIFLASFDTTKALEEASTKVIEAENTVLLLASTPTSALLGSRSEAEICGAIRLERPFI